jgi:hypothetical protein
MPSTIPAGSNAIKATNGPTAPRPSGSFLAPDLSRAELGLRPLGWAPATSLQNALTEFTHPTRSTGPALTSFAVAVARPDERRFGDFVPNRAAVTTTGERAFHVPAVP